MKIKSKMKIKIRKKIRSKIKSKDGTGAPDARSSSTLGARASEAWRGERKGILGRRIHKNAEPRVPGDVARHGFGKRCGWSFVFRPWSLGIATSGGRAPAVLAQLEFTNRGWKLPPLRCLPQNVGQSEGQD
jgi:hypothetical protein